MDIVWILCFILTVIQTVYCSLCPLVNERMNITRTIDPSTTSFITWNKNGSPILTAEYDSSTGTCTGPSSAADYTIYCADGGVYTLEIHKPADGDLYETASGTPSQRTYVQEPATMTVDITSTITTDTVLPGTATISMECQISSCTKPQPNITWQYMYTTDGGTTTNNISNTYIESTLNDTGCTGTLQDIFSKVEIFRDSVPLRDVPFKVECVLFYDVCTDNTYKTTTPYTITITDTTSSSLATPTSPTAVTSKTSPTSPTVITSKTSLTSQIPITSQSPVTSKTSITSKTSLTSKTSITSKTPVTSQTPITSQTSTSDSTTNNGSDSVKDTLIIIIVFSCIAGIIVIVIVVCCCFFLIRHYRSKKREEATDNSYDNNSAQFHGRIQPPFKTTDSVSVQTSSKPESRRHISSRQQKSTHQARGQVSSQVDSRKDAYYKRSKLYPELPSHASYSPYYSQATSSGYYGQAPSSGYYRQAQSSGYYKTAPSSGNYSQDPSYMYYSKPRSSASNPHYQSGGYRVHQPRHKQFDGSMFY